MEFKGTIGTQEDGEDEETQLVLKHAVTSVAVRKIEVGARLEHRHLSQVGAEEVKKIATWLSSLGCQELSRAKEQAVVLRKVTVVG